LRQITSIDVFPIGRSSASLVAMEFNYMVKSYGQEGSIELLEIFVMHNYPY